MNNEELNKAIQEVEDSGQFIIKGLEDTGKCISYIGWFWRNVNFDCDCVTLGICPLVHTEFENTDGFVGFMENNKWEYDEFYVKGEQKQELRQMVEKAVTKPSNKKLQALFDYMQLLRPRGIK